MSVIKVRNEDGTFVEIPVIQGSPGKDGAPGQQGDIGPAGPAGPSNTLTIGTVSGGSSAGASITGKSPNQVLNLVLPKGDPGEQGPQGQPGPAGEDGKTPVKGVDYFTSSDIASMASTTTPVAPGTATIGTQTKFARGDHRHPLQTTVSGNAGTATKLATARTITLSGGVTGSTTFDGSANRTISTTVRNASNSAVGGLKVRLDGTTLYITNNGSNA